MFRTIYPQREMLPAELRAGDTVTPAWSARIDPWDAAIVQEAHKDRVVIWRPYGAHTYGVYGGCRDSWREDPDVYTSVITLQGAETYEVSRSSTHLKFFVWDRLVTQEEYEQHVKERRGTAAR